MVILIWACAGVILLIGSFIQRVTGMGLALVASPFLVLTLGATTGVQILQVVGLGVCATSAWILRRDINYRRAGIMLVASVIGLVPGALVAKHLPSSWLSIVIGAVTLAALASSAWLKRSNVFRGTPGVGLAGALSGFMNVTAGVGGPPIVIYANSTGWPYAEYVATTQLYFVGLNILSLIGRGFPSVSITSWCVIVAAAAIGTFVGHKVGSKINEDVAHKAILIVALVGSLATVVRGVVALRS